MTPFRIGVIIFCGVIAGIALLIFSGVLPGFRSETIGESGRVVMWGTLDATYFSLDLVPFNLANKDKFSIEYVQKDPATLDQELTNALAEGNGPDLVVLPQDLINRHAKKIEVIPYTAYPEQTFKQAFIPEANSLMTEQGIIALPWYVDPLVLYYNDDILTHAGIPVPPKFWTEIQSPLSTGILKKVTVLDGHDTVLQSAIALGQFMNISNIKDILSLLIMQAGDNIVTGPPGALTLNFDRGVDTALNFFVQFSDPTKEQYTWNSALPKSIDFFTANKLALYLGRASDLKFIEQANPHLSFNATIVPQVDNLNPQTFGTLYSVAIMKASPKKSAALAAAAAFTGHDFSAIVAKVNPLPSARRDLLTQVADDNFKNVFYQSALISRSWSDPNPFETEKIFKEMVGSVLAGRLRISDAINGAQEKLTKLISE